MDAGPFLDVYTVDALIMVLLVGVIVTLLLVGGILMVNLGMMSKRPEDRVGKRTPSDVGILSGEVWPQVPHQRNLLPAEEEESEEEGAPIGHLPGPEPRTTASGPYRRPGVAPPPRRSEMPPEEEEANREEETRRLKETKSA